MGTGITYRPELDGLRAIAAVMVVLFHARAPGFLGGFIGVDVFFVLSGYLITRILDENQDLRRFYWRRFLRLTPPLVTLLAAYLLLYPMIRPDHPHGRDAWLAALYLSDYSMAFFEAPDYLRHTWSLSVEEHFYLLWPLVLIRLRPSIKTLVIAYIAATLWRWNWPDWREAYYRFDTHSSGLILGCIIARAKFPVSFPAWPALLVLLVACMTFRWLSPLVQGPGWTVVEVAAAAAVLGTPPAWLVTMPLVYVGRLSYGLYLWHYPIARVFRDAHDPWWITLAVSLGVGLSLAILSHHTIEAVFRRFKKEAALGHT